MLNLYIKISLKENNYKWLLLDVFMKKRVYIGADHAGFELKEKIKNYLGKSGFDFEDVGGIGDKTDDYPDFAHKVGNKVAKDKESFGILVCGTGAGVCIAVNKVKGIRAAQVYDKYTAKRSREHNDANVICFRGKDFDYNKGIKLLDIFLNTKYSNEKRHNRRISKIKRMER